MKNKIVVLISLSIIMFGGLSYYFYHVNDKDDNIIPDLSPQNKLSLIMVGDVIGHESVYKDAYNETINIYNFSNQLELIKPIINSYDLAFYNQETVLGGSELGVNGYPLFNSPFEMGDAFIDVGFNLVSTATNHTLDSGEIGVINSYNYWDKKDVLMSGSYSSTSFRDIIEIKEKNGIKYALLAYTYGSNESISNMKLLNIYSDEQAKKDIESIRDKVDLLIVSMHWGKEYESVTETQIKQANYLSNLGVNIIIGHHPHIIQPVTWINETLVLYSLGNFLSSQYQTDYYNKVVGLMSSVEIIKENDKITIQNLQNELIYNYYENNSNTNLRDNIKIIPFSLIDATYLSEYKNVYEKYKKVVQSLDSNINVLKYKENGD